MMVRYFENERDVVDHLLEVDGYKFGIKGELNERELKLWTNVIARRLVNDGIIKSVHNVTEIYYVKRAEKQKQGLFDFKIKAKKKRGTVINFWDYVREITVMDVYVIVNKIQDMDLFNNIEPFLLDCETIESLFDDNGEYIGSSKPIDDYILFRDEDDDDD